MKGLNKHFKLTLLILAIFFGLVISWNILRSFLISYNIHKNKPLATISTTLARHETWHPRIFAVGTLSSTNGVALSTQLAGNIVGIYFSSGQRVKKNNLLIQIDDRVEQAQLQNYQAAFKLAEITFSRQKELVKQGVVSKQSFDEAAAKYQQTRASVAQTEATIAYKRITAPFEGKIGINTVNLGQYVKPGDNLVILQALNPLYVNFYLPEKNLHQLHINQLIRLNVDAVPQKTFYGKINALNAIVDTQTHNITLQATVANPDEQLYPGLFARVQVILPVKKNVVTIPQTAINYTLYGDTVYVVNRHRQSKAKQGKDHITVSLREITLGEQQDNKLEVIRGLEAGEEIVTSGQLKLSNDQAVTINNTIQP